MRVQESEACGRKDNQRTLMLLMKNRKKPNYDSTCGNPMGPKRKSDQKHGYEVGSKRNPW
jgi:hypothetical protein